MKSKFIQTLYALILPISFIVVLFILTTFSLLTLDKYGLGGIVVTFFAITITYVALKIDNKSFRDINFCWESKTPIRFLTGFFIGFLIAMLMLVIMISFTDLKLVNNKDSNIPIALLWLLGFFPLAFMEEIIFRGYAFIKINKTVGLWPAQILLAILFAWYHDYTGTSFLNQLIGPGIWALIFGIAAVWSKGLAFPTGLHMALNVVLALVGQKDERHAIWNIEYTTEITQSLKSQTETVGIILQIILLIIAVVLTEHFTRNKLKTSRKQKL